MADIASDPAVANILQRASGLDDDKGDPRLKAILHDILSDSFRTIERHQITPEEFWRAVHFAMSGAQEYPLWFAALGFEILFDLLTDRQEAAIGMAPGTPRTIEGPLYVAGAPISEGGATLNDPAEQGRTLKVSGRVLSTDGSPIEGAVLDIWQANTAGAYSHFDPSQPQFNYRRRIRVGKDGCYSVDTLEPAGYGAPAGGSTEALMTMLGRHANRPAHIHFFVGAPGHRHLTTQINIADDPLVDDDFALATRAGLSPPIKRNGDSASITFDFVLPSVEDISLTRPFERPRANA